MTAAKARRFRGTSLERLRARLDAACRDAGRRPPERQLLPVTKFFPASDVLDPVRARVPRIRRVAGAGGPGKIAEVEPSGRIGVRWHMIGRLPAQQGEGRSRTGRTRSIRWTVSGSSTHSARGDVSRGGELPEPLRVLLQVSLDGDPRAAGAATPTSNASPRGQCRRRDLRTRGTDGGSADRRRPGRGVPRTSSRYTRDSARDHPDANGPLGRNDR